MFSFSEVMLLSVLFLFKRNQVDLRRSIHKLLVRTCTYLANYIEIFPPIFSELDWTSYIHISIASLGFICILSSFIQCMLASCSYSYIAVLRCNTGNTHPSETYAAEPCITDGNHASLVIYVRGNKHP